MANPIQLGSGTPPIPQRLPVSNGPQTLQQQPQQQPPVPAPTHAQTVAVLRHATAIARELRGLLALPELGRSDVKPKIIDGTTNLVASRILSPGQAVASLSSVPSDPLQQRKWVQAHYQTTMAAMNDVLDHHSAAFPWTGDTTTEIDRSQSDPENHFDDIKAVMAHYRPGGGDDR